MEEDRINNAWLELQKTFPEETYKTFPEETYKAYGEIKVINFKKPTFRQRLSMWILNLRCSIADWIDPWSRHDAYDVTDEDVRWRDD